VRKFGAKLLLCGIMVALVVGAGALWVTAQDCKTEAPDTISIKDPKWEQHTKCPVEFTHKTHAEDYGVACADCHHVYQDGQNVWKQGDPACACSSCHTELTITGEKKLPEDQQKLNLKLAFHNNCVECHKEKKKEDPKTGAPVTCTGCHPKECAS